MNLIAAIQALRAGKELANAATWKNRQNAVNALIGLLGFAAAAANAFGFAVELNDELVFGLATGVWAAVNLYFTTATTSKIGLRAKDGTSGLDGERDGTGSGA